MRLTEALANTSRILLDTAPVIYHLERHPAYAPLMAQFFAFQRQQRVILVTTPVTLAECLVHPMQRGLNELAEAYRLLITNANLTEFRLIGHEEAELAARLRAQYQLRLADALQFAVAIQSGCKAMLTNDSALRKVSEIRPIILSELDI